MGIITQFLDNERIDTHFTTCAEYGGILYFFIDGYIMPVQYDIATGKYACLLPIKEMLKLEASSFDKTEIYNNKLIAVRNNGKSIVVLSIKEREILEVKIDGNKREWGNFGLITLYNNKLFCFCKEIPKVIIMNCDSLNVTEEMLHTNMDRGITAGTVKGNQAVLYQDGCDYFIKYSLDNSSIEILKINGDINDISSVQIYQKEIYILNQKGEICIVRADGSIQKEKIGFENEFGQIVIANNIIILFPAKGKKILRYDLKIQKSEVVNNYPSDYYEDENIKKSKYFFPYESVNDYYFGNRISNYVTKICKKTGEIYWIHIPNIKREIYLEKCIFEGKRITEEKNFSVSNYLNYLNMNG